MVNSMTGFASQAGKSETHQWVWDVRSVNNKGLDIKVRLPSGSDAIEQKAKKVIRAYFVRGSIQLGISSKSNDDMSGVSVDPERMNGLLEVLVGIEALARDKDLALAPGSAQEVLRLYLDKTQSKSLSDDQNWLTEAAKDLEPLMQNLAQMRATEGAQLAEMVSGQLDQVHDLIKQAEAEAENRTAQRKERLGEQVKALLSDADKIDEDRLEQELALLAIKADITEEIDRLYAHVTAARDLLASEGAIGRKLDFLMQEFNREANTLCSKSGSSELTRIGLALKTVIEQMREQVQNIE